MIGCRTNSTNPWPLTSAGVDVVDLGLCGTEEIYFAAFHLAVDGGVIVTASHNPADYNGMKLVRQGARPISGDTGLREIERLAAEGRRVMADTPGSLTRLDNKPAYIDHLLGYVDKKALKPLKIVANPGNGCAGAVIDRLADPAAVIAGVEAFYAETPGEKDYTDGLSFTAENFRFNIRSSNTEPVLRLNVESRGDAAIMKAKTAEILSLIRA